MRTIPRPLRLILRAAGEGGGSRAWREAAGAGAQIRRATAVLRLQEVGERTVPTSTDQYDEGRRGGGLTP